MPGRVEQKPQSPRGEALRSALPSARLGPKFHPPSARAGIVGRDALVERLLGSDASVITLVAPPGYGKTTVLAQWAERLGRRVAWVSCDKADDDPVALWTAVAAAISAVSDLGPAPLRLLAASGGSIEVVPAFVAAIEPIGAPMTIVLDHLEHIANEGCHAALAEFAMRIPVGWQLALASRERLPIKAAGCVLKGSILELGSRELAMTAAEAEALLVGAGVEAPASWIDDLVRRTEGWPVGVYLAALAMEAGKPIGNVAFGGDDRWVSDYLRSELLARVEADQADLLMRTSILDRLSGPLCDAVAGVTGAARALEDLAGQNMLVLPLDRHREWYRYHHLLRDHLHAELRVEHADEIPLLHSRAASWYEANDMPEAALDHAQAAGDADRVAALILTHMSPVWASGRVATVLSWMQWLEGHPSARHYAAVMAHGSLIYALLGRTGDAERWANVAEQMPTGEALPDGSSVEGTLAYLRANLAREGVATMRHDARVAQQALDSRQSVPADDGARRGCLTPARRRSRVRGHGSVPRVRHGHCVRQHAVGEPDPGRAWGGRHGAQRLGGSRLLRTGSPRHRRRRRLRRLLDQRAGPGDGRTDCRAPGRHAGGAAPGPARRTAAPGPHLRAPCGVGPGLGRARPCQSGVPGPWRGGSGPGPSGRDSAATS